MSHSTIESDGKKKMLLLMDGVIGVSRVVRAAPDGYTVIFGNWSTHVVNGAMYSLPYDVVGDFEPIALLSTNPQVIILKKALPTKDARELIAWMKANSGKATLGTTGPGSPPHMAGLHLQNLIGTRFQFIPYRGAAPGMQDLIAGQIDLGIPQAAVVLPLIESNSVRAYAITAKTRLSMAPSIPSADEAGLSGLYVATWSGLWAPKGTPQSGLRRLNAAVVETLADQSVRSRLAALGQELFPPEQQTPEALIIRTYQKAEIEKWWPIIKAAGVKGE